MGFHTMFGLEPVDFSCGEGGLGLVTSSHRPVLWVNGSSEFSQRSLFQGYLGGGISASGCLFHVKGRAMLEVGVRPSLEARELLVW